MKKENVVVKQSSHSRGMLSGIYNACRCKIKDHSLINRCVEDPRYQPSGMTPLFNNNAFTLIELLVVVLIIGILAAVAVPQYQRAVKKSRYSILKSLTRSLETAEEVYFLSYGGYTADIDALDISFSETPTSITKTTGKGVYSFPWGKCELLTEQIDHQPRIVCENTNISMAYGVHLLHLNNDTAHAGKHRCVARVSTDTIAHAICKQETGQQNPMIGVNYWY